MTPDGVPQGPWTGLGYIVQTPVANSADPNKWRRYDLEFVNFQSFIPMDALSFGFTSKDGADDDQTFAGYFGEGLKASRNSPVPPLPVTEFCLFCA